VEGMGNFTESRSRTAPEARCSVCRHKESEHGRTGTRPCLAMTGPILKRDFCACDRFQPGTETRVVAAPRKDAVQVAHKPAA